MLMLLSKTSRKKAIFLILFSVSFIIGRASGLPTNSYELNLEEYEISDTIFISENALVSEQKDGRPNPVLQMFRIKQKKNKKITAAILAFPFPFGIVGLHRIYLGTAPYVPVVYIGTLGGVFGILPFIDFCVLCLDKDISRYLENKKVLMWVDENKKPSK